MNGWLPWGYLLSALAQLLLVILVTSICLIIINNTIVTIRNRWKRNQ